MSLLHEPAPPLSLVHWIIAILLADLVAALIFVAWLYGPLFFDDAALSADVLPSLVGPFLLGGFLSSFFLVWKTWRRHLPTVTAVWLGILMSLVTALAMAIYASMLTGESTTGYLVKVFTAQFFTVMSAGALSGAAQWYYLHWVRGPDPNTPAP